VNRLVCPPPSPPDSLISLPLAVILLQEDSVILWKAVCSNKLLANVDLVLFLNKCDILEAKLNSGINVSKYIKSYGDRSNDVDSVSKCECCTTWKQDLFERGLLWRGFRLKKQIWRNTPRVFPKPTEVLCILHFCHGM